MSVERMVRDEATDRKLGEQNQFRALARGLPAPFPNAIEILPGLARFRFHADRGDAKG